MQNTLYDRPWREFDLIGFDTETTGKYPLTAEVCELAAVKWRGGEVVETFHSLLKPSKEMGSEVIAIHGITNAMVDEAPRMSEKIAEFRKFIEGGIVIAHHAPFDLGFLAVDLEKNGLTLPAEPVICSSLLSRRLFPESKNHRLQTLIDFFGLTKGVAHRATDDAKACLEVAIRCLQKLDDIEHSSAEGDVALSRAFSAQGGALSWNRFSMRDLEASNASHRALAEASRTGAAVEMVYLSGSKPGEARIVMPHGIVRSLDGDFVVAYDTKAQQSKRYMLDLVKSAVIV